MKINKIVIVGLGSIGTKHLIILRKLLPESIIKILHHNTSEKYPNQANGVLKNISEALAFFPDLVIISNPSPYHLNYAIPFSEKGINLFIEKPLSSNLKNIKKFLSKVKTNKTFVSLGYNLRFVSSLIEFKKQLIESDIGKIYFFNSVAGQYLPDWRPKLDYTKNVSANKNLGGGVLLELSHEIDYARWLFGEVEFTNGQIFTNSNLDINVEDTAYILLKFKQNLQNHKMNGLINLDFVRRNKTRECSVVGENGTLNWNALNSSVNFYSSETHKWKTLYKDELDLNESYIKQWMDVINRIEKKLTPSVNVLDGIRTLEIIEAIKLSSVNNREVKIEYEFN